MAKKKPKKELLKTTPKKKLFLHIGRHKTGTSSLQNFFTQKSELLAERGILYPATGRKTPHATQATAHHNFSHILRYKPMAEVNALLAQLVEEAKDFDTILLSSEDFQNQKDFSRLAEFFKDYDLTVIVYIREGLGYGLSGFAQRIHFSGEIFNIRQYMERQNIRITAFIKNWSRLADASVFRLYERDKLKNRDIVADFLDIIGLDDVEDTNVTAESNPSLSGNLLGLKMLLNLMGQSMLTPYVAFEAAARLDRSFNGKIFISDRVAEELRGLDDYNAVLKTMFPDMTEPSFEGGSKVFDLSRWDADMDLIATVPEFAFAKTLRLGALGQVLENYGVAADLGETDFLTQEMIAAIKLPDGAQIQQVRERAVGAANDAVLARKARADAERAAAKANADALASTMRRDEMSEKLKSRTKKLEKDTADAISKLEDIKKERDAAIETFKSSAMKALADRDLARKEMKVQVEKTNDDLKVFKAQAESALRERDVARLELRSQAEAAKSQAAEALSSFNKRIADITSERDALLAQLKAQAKKSGEDLETVKATTEKALADRDAARAEIKSQAEKMKSEAAKSLTVFNEKLATLTSDRQVLSEKLKSMGEAHAADLQAFKGRAEKAIEDRDAAREALAAREIQMNKQAAQVYYFRGELLFLKGEGVKAQEMYAQAVELDPENEDYIHKLNG